MKLLKPAALTLLILITAGLSIKYFVFSPIQNKLNAAPAIDKTKVLLMINEERLKANAPALTYSTVLEKAAELKAGDILAKQYFDHVSPSGESLEHWLDAATYRYRVAGENLSWDFYSTEGLMGAWMRSERHRKNILEPDYTETGLAAVTGRLFGRDTVVVVEMFGQRAK